MKANLVRRIEAMESHTCGSCEFIWIQRQIARPGVPPGEAAVAECMGRHFERAADESEGQFLDRVRSAVICDLPPGFRASHLLVMEESDRDG